jgi:probable phosphoglycerate mutase
LTSRRPQARRRPRRKGRASSDGARRALAKRHALAAVKPPREGFAVLHADGGARGMPGPAAIGYVLDAEAGVRLAEQAESIGTSTAAEAEYRALLSGLAHAHRLGLTRVIARSDSRLLVAHINGERDVRNPQLLALGAQISDLRMRIGAVIFEWVPANANTDAHELVAARLVG